MNHERAELAKAVSEYGEAMRELTAARHALALGGGDPEPWRRVGAAEARVKAAAARLSRVMDAPTA